MATANLNLNIKDILMAVRDQLEESQKERVKRGKEPFFRTDSLELELQFVAVEEEVGSGKFDLKIIGVGGKASYRSEQIQTVRLRLETVKPKRGGRVRPRGDFPAPPGLADGPGSFDL